MDYEELTTEILDSPTIEELNSVFKIEFMRKLSYEQNDNIESDVIQVEFIVIYMTDKCWIQVEFDQNRQFIDFHEFYITEYSKDEFKHNINSGMSISEVMNIDINGDYSFLSTSWTDYPKYSYHYLIDGNVAVIGYDDSDCVVSLNTYSI